MVCVFLIKDNFFALPFSVKSSLLRLDMSCSWWTDISREAPDFVQDKINGDCRNKK